MAAGEDTSRIFGVPMVATTDYVNTIPVDQEAELPGNEEYERYRAYTRWNAAVMVHGPVTGRRIG